MTAFEEDLRELNQRYAEFEQEARSQYPWQNAASYDGEKLRYILTRLAFWSGVFTAFAHRSQAHQQAGNYFFPFRLLETTQKVDKLTAYFAQADNAARRAPAPAAKPAAAQAKKMSLKEETDLHCRRIQEEIRINQSKSTNLMIRKQRALSQGRVIGIAEEPGAGICGQIHMSCGHSSLHGRCKRKMSHGVDFKDSLHECNMCAQNFTG